MEMIRKKIKTQEGYIALISVLIISATIFVLAINASLFGVAESDMGLQKFQSSAAFYLATLCAEDALMKLKDDLKYQGDEILTVDDETCTILPLEGGGNQNRVIMTTGVVGGKVRKIKIEIDQVNPVMKIKSWREVVEF